MQHKYICLLLLLTAFTGCKKLEQIPQSTASKQAVFGSEKGLELYVNSMYAILPGANNVHTADNVSDYAARRDAPAFLRDGAYSPSISDNTSASASTLVALGPDWNWAWNSLRNVNYFIVNNIDPAVPEDVRRHYMGVARFFRAFFYFEKVKRYGDVPWINKPLDPSDTTVFKGRDPRTLVIDSILADIDYATQNIKTLNDPSRTLITKWVAYAFKARVCLFEGTFRKYHTELAAAVTNTSPALLTQAAAAAKEVMDRSGYKLYEGAGVAASYRKVFTSTTPVTDEVMLAAVSDVALGVLHSANWYYTSATTGIRFNFIRTFINTYLNIDGTPFTSRANYDKLEFKDEVKGRDRRLEQTIRAGDYKRNNAGTSVAAPPVFSYTYTGYMPIKWSMDDVKYDNGTLNDNAVSIFRYAEVLLNYAEAKGELGTLTDAEWAATIGALRKRAGITGGLTAKPTVPTPVISVDANNTLVSSASTGNQWYLSGTAIQGATGKIYQPVQTGIYTVRNTSNGCTSSFSPAHTFTVTGIIDLGNNQYIRVFPNPVYDKLYLNWNINGVATLNVIIIDIQGKQVEKRNNVLPGFLTDLTRLPKGMYVLKIFSSNDKLVHTMKITKN